MQKKYSTDRHGEVTLRSNQLVERENNTRIAFSNPLRHFRWFGIFYSFYLINMHAMHIVYLGYTIIYIQAFFLFICLHI